MTQTQQAAIREARRAVNALRLEVIPEIADSVSAKVEAAFASLEADAKRLDWLENEGADVRLPNDEVEIFFQFAPGGVAKYSVGGRGATDANGLSLREAIDAASTEEPSR